MIKKQGFTLAEVLITLGIIGVVAAMTIPTLISNTNGAQFKTAYKKALSTLNQAVLMNVALEDTDLSRVAADTSATSNVGIGAILHDRMQAATDIASSYSSLTQNQPVLTESNGNSAPKLVYTVTCTKNGNTWTAPTAATGQTVGTCNAQGVAEVEETMSTTLGDYVKLSFADGTAFWYNKNANNCTDTEAAKNKCYGFIDVNAATGPNQVISCANASNGKCDSSEISDIFPVVFHGQTFEPATDSARAVLFGK